jgi:hypothetical protein
MTKRCNNASDFLFEPLNQSSFGDPEAFEASSPVALPFSALGKHMRVPSQLCPHQQKPSALMMQVPLPQQRSSSMIISRLFLIGYTDLRLYLKIGHLTQIQ